MEEGVASAAVVDVDEDEELENALRMASKNFASVIALSDIESSVVDELALVAEGSAEAEVAEGTVDASDEAAENETVDRSTEDAEEEAG